MSSQGERRTGPEYLKIRCWVDESDNLTRVLVIAALFCFYATLGNWNEWATDFSALYYAGHFFATGEWDQIFAAPREVIGPDIPERWQSVLVEQGHWNEQTFPFIYPPWVAAAIAPVAMYLDPMTAMNAFLLLNTVLIMLSGVLAYRIMSPLPVQLWIWMAFTAWAMFNTIAPLIALHLGQAQILVIFLSLLAFERLISGRTATAGVVLALAAMIKLSPLFLGLIFLWNREWRALAAFVATGLLGVVLAVLFLGWDLHATYLDRLETISRHLYLIHFAYSMEAFLYQVWDWSLGTAVLLTEPGYYYLKPEWIANVCKAGLVVSVALVWVSTRNEKGKARLQRQVLALSVAVPLFMPLGWAHYFIMAQLLLPGMIVLMSPRIAVPVLAVFVFSQTKYLRAITNSEPHFVYWDIIISVPVLFLILVVLLATARRHPAARAEKTAGALPAE